MYFQLKYLAWIAIIFLLYLLNNSIKSQFDNKYIALFMRCYFNDLIGTVAFLLAYHVVLTLLPRPSFRIKLSLFKVELFVLCCGCFWEFIVPLIRPSSVTDLFDFFAYLLGGYIYWRIAGKQFNKQLKQGLR